MEEGIVMNIQKFSVHDGPGIRTTVFLKGCPLSCWWCHNPESLNKNYQVLYFQDKCSGCQECIKNCKQEALSFKDERVVIDRKSCVACGECTDICLNDAREFVGEKLTSQEVLERVLKDQVFYEQSGGGVTFSGGEPFLQTEFLVEVLEKCKSRGIHTTIDSSFYTKWENIERTLPYTDLYLVDIKHMVDQDHKKYTGVSNTLILENLNKLSNEGKRIFVRMPIIKGINDSDLHIDRAIEFLRDLNIEQVNLLPYHKMGMEKYKRLDESYRLTGEEVPTDERLKLFENKFKLNGIKVKIGG